MMKLSKSNRVMAASAIGNMLEWYDFALYGYFAIAIGHNFFPKENPVVQVISAFGIFAIGFLMRPLGALVLGNIGDKYGRTHALTISIIAMAVPTFLVGVLPGYATLGIAAPILLIMCRMAQGLSVGGEFTTSFIFTVEHAPTHRRGFMSALCVSGATLGTLLGSATGAGISSFMSPDDLQAWGWRIPFLFGLLIGIVGYVLRKGVEDNTEPTLEKVPLQSLFKKHYVLLIQIAGLSVFTAVGFYFTFVYMVSWLEIVDKLAPEKALSINTMSMIALIVIIIFTGWLSDHIGRKLIMLVALLAAAIFGMPLFQLMFHADPTTVLFAQLGIALMIGSFLGTMPAFLVEAVPEHIRCTAIAIGYNLTVGVLGGLVPLIASWTIKRTANELSPGYLLISAAIISFLVLLTIKKIPIGTKRA